MTNDLVPVQTRIEPSFYEEIKSHAKIHNRSISREVVQLLMEAMYLRQETTHQFVKPRKKK